MATDRLSGGALSEAIRSRALDLGFEAAGIARLRASDHADFYRAWIGRGLHGDMAYLARDDAMEARLTPERRWPELVSAVVVAHHYAYPESPDQAEAAAGEAAAGGAPADVASSRRATLGDPSTGVFARYARGRDYHRVVKKKLMALLRWLEGEVGRELPVARAYVDTGPVLERELARRAGLGWFGRNTMLIDPERGSYFLLGALLLPLELDYDAPFEADRCGSCTACIPACPTDALLGRDENGAPVMDATRCISYLTIENQGPIPEELRPLMGNRVYGCDICQEACPWNGDKVLQISAEPDYRPGRSGRLPGTDSPSLVELLRMALDPEAWDAFTRGSAIRRAGRAGLARNVCVAMGNWLAEVNEPPEAAAEVLRDALDDPAPLVRGHAAWALEQARLRPRPGGPPDDRD